MWVSKVAIIMYLFSVGLTFSGYYINNASGLSLFDGATYAALDDIMSRNEIDEDISIDLIFGDFIAGVRVLFGIVTGDTISQAFGMLPNFDETWMILTRILFTTSSAFLWIYIVAGRVL
jgi:hypothetical protein